MSSAVKQSPEEYLRLLQERNRLKKKLSEKTPEQAEMEERERGFVTHFRGANRRNEMKETKEVDLIIKSKEPQKSVLKEKEVINVMPSKATQVRNELGNPKTKKKWGEGQDDSKIVFFGVKVPVNDVGLSAKGNTQENQSSILYEDDFEADNQEVDSLNSDTNSCLEEVKNSSILDEDNIDNEPEECSAIMNFGEKTKSIAKIPVSQMKDEESINMTASAANEIAHFVKDYHQHVFATPVQSPARSKKSTPKLSNSPQKSTVFDIHSTKNRQNDKSVSSSVEDYLAAFDASPFKKPIAPVESPVKVPVKLEQPVKEVEYDSVKLIVKLKSNWSVVNKKNITSTADKNIAAIRRFALKYLVPTANDDVTTVDINLSSASVSLLLGSLPYVSGKFLGNYNPSEKLSQLYADSAAEDWLVELREDRPVVLTFFVPKALDSRILADLKKLKSESTSTVVPQSHMQLFIWNSSNTVRAVKEVEINCVFSSSFSGECMEFHWEGDLSNPLISGYGVNKTGILNTVPLFYQVIEKVGALNSISEYIRHSVSKNSSGEKLAVNSLSPNIKNIQSSIEKSSDPLWFESSTQNVTHSSDYDEKVYQAIRNSERRKSEISAIEAAITVEDVISGTPIRKRLVFSKRSEKPNNLDSGSPITVAVSPTKSVIENSRPAIEKTKSPTKLESKKLRDSSIRNSKVVEAQSEDNLRKSLEGLKFSDTFLNPSRIGSNLALNSLEEEENRSSLVRKGSDINFEQLDNSSQISETHAFADSVELKVQNRRRALNKDVAAAESANFSRESFVPTVEAKQHRRKRISDIQNTVQALVENIANIKDSRRGNKSISSNIKPNAVESDLEPIIHNQIIEDVVDVPVIPKGWVLTFYIYSNWGDLHYLGLNGIEIFDKDGLKLAYSESQLESDDYSKSYFIQNISANPSDVNIMSVASPSLRSSMAGTLASLDFADPRVISNVLDGVNFTKDDLHMWLAPIGYCTVRHHNEDSELLARICIEISSSMNLKTVPELSCIRIWNYNKSRTHATRGIKDLMICWELIRDDGLQTSVLVQDRVCQAPGILGSVKDYDSQCCCYHDFFFTDATSVVTRVNSSLPADCIPVTPNKDVAIEEVKHAVDRPSTADSISNSNELVSGYSPSFGNVDSSISVLPVGDTPSLESTLGDTIMDIAARDLIEDEQAYERSKVGVSEHVNEKSNIAGAVYKSDDFLGFLNELKSLEQLTTLDKEPTSVFIADPGVKLTSTLVNCISIVIDTTWHSHVIDHALGNYHHVHEDDFAGLMGIEFLSDTGEPVDLPNISIHAEPRDLSAIGLFDDPRCPEKLLKKLSRSNGNTISLNNSTYEINSWLIPFTKGANSSENFAHFITFQFSKDAFLSGVNVWNYNKGNEGITRGVKNARLYINNKFHSRFILRPAPGLDGVSFHQRILFSELSDYASSYYMRSTKQGTKNDFRGAYISPIIRQDYEVPQLPSGMLWKFTFLSNHGDDFYIGLDALELFDENGCLVDVLSEAEVSAVPHSINDLQGTIVPDKRVPFNLFSNVNTQKSSAQWAYTIPEIGSAVHGHGWLAPIASTLVDVEREKCAERMCGSTPPAANLSAKNTLFLAFHKPITLSLIRIYNYSKSVERGVKEMMIEVDTKLLYFGNIPSCDRTKVLSNKNYVKDSDITMRKPCQTLIMNQVPKLLSLEKDNVLYCGTSEQDVLFINDRQVMARAKHMYVSKPKYDGSNGVSTLKVDISKRPSTATMH